MTTNRDSDTEKEEKSKKKVESESEDYEKNLNKQLEQIPEEVKKDIEKVKEILSEYTKKITKKYSFIQSIGIIPPIASELIEEEEEIQKEKDQKLVHVLLILPDEKIKDSQKILKESIEILNSSKPKIWMHIKSISEMWEIAFDGKYSMLEAMSMSFPLYDKGVLGGIRAASIHKMLILKKFERYVVSYVVAGSFVRGTAVKTSDIDVAIIIDDTDVKRMSRYELKEKLRSIIYTYAFEASEKAGVKNKLSPQIYILTEFWEAVKDAHPVIFTFIRDGVPFYDRGAFMPWKLLLKMGKIKPSPEAIEMFMGLGEKVAENVKRKLNDIVIEDLYWGVITPSQALLMLYGVAPPTPRETYSLMKEIFVDKEKLLELKYVKTLEKIVEIYKKYEHEKIKSISGKEIDEMLQECSEYTERLKQLMGQIEKRTTEKEIEKGYESIFELLKIIFGNNTEQKIISLLEKELIAKGKLPRKVLITSIKILEYKNNLKTKKISKQEFNELKREVHETTSLLLEYSQRKELDEMNNKKIEISFDNKKAELFVFKDYAFLVPDFTSEKIKKMYFDGKIEETNRDDLKNALSKNKNIERKINIKLINLLRKVVGEFEINLN